VSSQLGVKEVGKEHGSHHSRVDPPSSSDILGKITDLFLMDSKRLCRSSACLNLNLEILTQWVVSLLLLNGSETKGRDSIKAAHISSGPSHDMPSKTRDSASATTLSALRVCLTRNLKGANRNTHLPSRSISLTLLRSHQRAKFSQCSSNSLY